MHYRPQVKATVTTFGNRPPLTLPSTSGDRFPLTWRDRNT